MTTEQEWEATARELARWYLGAGEAGRPPVTELEVDETVAAARAAAAQNLEQPVRVNEVPGQLGMDEVLVCRD